MVEISRSCNLCNEKMTGGIAGFIRHGEEYHQDHFLNFSTKSRSPIYFAEKKFYCPLDNRWYSNRIWLARTIKSYGITNEQYYQCYGEHYLPEYWHQNTSDPVLGNARNHSKCIKCDGPTHFQESRWKYSAFCSFKCSTKWYADNTDRPQRAMKTLKERQAVDPTLCLTPTQVDYWTVKKGLTIEGAREKVRERQRTNSLERFIQRAGGDEAEGAKQWTARQEKWLDSLEKRGWFGNQSVISNEMFTELQKKTAAHLLFGEHELSVKVGHRVLKPDCGMYGSKKIIEFFGDYWHANPSKYTENQTVRRLDVGGFVTAKEIWARDQKRLDLLKQYGFNVLVIWENDYTTDPATAIDRCILHLNS